MTILCANCFSKSEKTCGKSIELAGKDYHRGDIAPSQVKANNISLAGSIQRAGLWSVMKNKKGQMKIQEMAFVLVAVIIFFGLVAVFYFSIRMTGLKSDVANLQQDEARAMVKKLASSPEFAWTATDCSNCVDMDKVMVLKNQSRYKGFWGMDYLRVERVYPIALGKECTPGNYPNCQSITLVPKDNFGSPPWAFVSLCRYDFSKEQSYMRCELGKIYATVNFGGAK